MKLENLKRAVRDRLGDDLTNRIVKSKKYTVDHIRWFTGRRASLPQKQSKLHLGCGPVTIDGYVHIDAYPFPNVHYLRDIRSPNLWQPESAELIYVSHALEHVPRNEVLELLRRWRTFLEPNGILRVSVPDFSVLHQLYAETGDVHSIAPPLMGGQSNSLDFHYSIFDQKSLTQLLNEAGFSGVRVWEPGETEVSGLDWASYKVEVSGSERYLSLNLEATK